MQSARSRSRGCRGDRATCNGRSPTADLQCPMVLWSVLLHLPVVFVACGLALSALPFFSLSFALVVVRSLRTATCNWRQSSAEGFVYKARCISVGVLGALPGWPARPVAEPIVLGCHLRTTMGRGSRSSAAWYPTTLDLNIKVTGGWSCSAMLKFWALSRGGGKHHPAGAFI